MTTGKIRQAGRHRLAAALGAFALGVSGALVLGTTASADPAPGQPGAKSEGTLTINKYAGLPVEQGGDTTNPLTGVEFTVTQVGLNTSGSCVAIDLTDAAQWTGLEADLFDTAPAEPEDPFCLLTPLGPQETVAGSTTFTLPVGVYFVQETDPGDNPIVSPVPNFYVSIPTSEGAGGDGWNYAVEADPKNQLMDEPTKTITEQPSAPVVGSTVTWNLTIPVPTLAEGETFDSGSVTDILDDRLAYDSSSVKIGDVALAEGSDYTLDAGVVKWTFDKTLLDEHQGEDITIQLVTRVVTVGDGAIDNPGGVDGGYSSEFNGTTVPGGTTPYTYWGQLSILKVDNSTPAKNLKDAEFKVFAPNAAGTCEATAPTTGALASGRSDDNGVVQWDGANPGNVLGLWIANSPDAPLPNASRNYCVYETAAPAGHTADLSGRLVTITPGAPVQNQSALTVVNTKKSGPDLPLTGAGGTAVMMTGGLLTIGAGVVAMVLIRRRRSQVA